MALSREEVNRKLLHVLSGSMIPAWIFYLPQVAGVHRWFPSAALGVVTAFLIAVELLRFRYPRLQRYFYTIAGGALRPEEAVRFTGATWIFAAGFLCSLAFFNVPHISFIVLCLFILGDAAAALVGQSIGRIRIGKKSLEGTLGCFTLCLVLCLAVFPLVPGILDTWGGRMPIALALIASAAIAVLELFPLQLSQRFVINDNLSVPLLTGAIILAAQRFVL